MNAADIYRYSNRADVDNAIRTMQERIVEELRMERGPLRQGGLATQAANGREEYRQRLSRTQAWQEAWDVTAQHYRDEYMRIEHEVMTRWGIDA